MIEMWATVPLLLGLVTLVAAFGCDAGPEKIPFLTLTFHYDPTLVIGGTTVVINQVVFKLEAVRGSLVSAMHREGHDAEIRLVSDGRIMVTVAGEDDSSDRYGYADPVAGDYRFISGIKSKNGILRLGVRCEAYRSAGDAFPTFPSSGSASEADVTGNDLYFPFRLVEQNGAWGVLPE
jgi:hypothetical protein